MPFLPDFGTAYFPVASFFLPLHIVDSSLFSLLLIPSSARILGSIRSLSLKISPLQPCRVVRLRLALPCSPPRGTIYAHVSESDGPVYSPYLVCEILLQVCHLTTHKHRGWKLTYFLGSPQVRSFGFRTYSGPSDLSLFYPFVNIQNDGALSITVHN